MRIKAENAQSFVDHCKALESLTGRDGIEVYKQLRRLEEEARLLAEEVASEDRIKEIHSIVESLIPNTAFFMNGGPRGYQLKLSLDAPRVAGLLTDFGGYQVLAPNFLV